MKIAVIGSINVDMTVTASRIPNKGETIHGTSLHLIPGGKGANQAVAMAKLGADVEMFGCVGDDVLGVQMLDNLKKQNVRTDHIQTVRGESTGNALITVAEHDNTIVVVPGANGRVDRAYVDSVMPSVREYDMVVLQHEIPLDTVNYIIDRCYEEQIPVLLNPAPAARVDAERMKKLTYLTPNEHEAALIYGEDRPLEEVLRQYPEKLVVTRGSKGVSTCLADGTILTVPSRKVEVVDTTGAGDTLNGAFAVRITAGDDMKSALIYANAAASLSIQKFGAQGGMPTASEVEEVLS
ncbi:MAG: ribokinase [Eubacteriales bacterium]